MADLLDRLGGIPLTRIRLRPAPGTATEEDVLRIDAKEDRLCELIDGVLVEKPMAIAESILGIAIGSFLRAFVVAANLGLVAGADGMVRLFPGMVRIPDIAFYSWDRLPGRRYPTTPIGALAPDLAVEILSKTNTKAEMARKRQEYFQAGVQLVWEIDPEARTVAVYTGPEQCIVLTQDQTLDGGDVLPGFTLPLRELFAELDRQGNA